MSFLSSRSGTFAGRHPYPDQVNDTGPLAWWPLNASLGDRIGGRDGTIGAGSAVYAASLPIDHGASFDCAGANWISVAHDAALKPAMGSLMAWFKPNDLDLYYILSANTSGLIAGDFGVFTGADGTIKAFWQTGSAETRLDTTDPYYAAGQTVHVLCTWDGDGVALYLDGNLIETSSVYTGGLTGNAHDWHFGHSQLGDDVIFDGVVDEIALWDRVLTRNEIYLLAQIEAPS